MSWKSKGPDEEVEKDDVVYNDLEDEEMPCYQGNSFRLDIDLKITRKSV